MSNRVSYIITDNNITVNYDGQTHIVPRKDSLASRLIDAIRNKNLDEIPKLVSMAKRVEEFGRGNFQIQNNKILINGREAPPILSGKIIRFMTEGLPVEPLIKFAENLLKNPSYRSVNELFQFLEKNDHPLTDNGCFIAYKKVRDDFKDVHSGTFDNSVGTTVEMPRNQVNEDSTQTCSYGLHVANWDYAHKFYSGGVMLEVEVNPADVVAIPTDYDQAKMRVCRYTVLSVVDREHSTETTLRTTNLTAPLVPGPEPLDACEADCCECGYAGCDGNDCEEEEPECSECGSLLNDSEDGICDDCVEEEEEIAEEEEEEGYCTECDALLLVCCGETLCCSCDPKDEEDAYPWEDELEEE